MLQHRYAHRISASRVVTIAIRPSCRGRTSDKEAQFSVKTKVEFFDATPDDNDPAGIAGDFSAQVVLSARRAPRRAMAGAIAPSDLPEGNRRSRANGLSNRSPPAVLSEKQVVEIVPVARATLYRMVKNGRFPRGTFVSPNRRV